MPDHRVSVVVFEGGHTSSRVEEEMTRVRRALVLDLVDTLGGIRDVDEIIVGTNYHDLAQQATSRGATAQLIDETPFHFGRVLKSVIDEHGLERVIYLGGGAMPLLDRSDWQSIARCLKTQDDVVVVNNVQSADLVAFSPSSALDEIDLPEADNLLGWLLREHGLRRILIPNSARANFDLDTPTDIEILKLQTTVPLGPNTTRELKMLDWDTSRLETAWARMAVPYTEIALIGRVGPPVISIVNAALRCRVRVFSEERGMKALGREEDGKVVSLLGHFLDSVGPEAFFRHLADVAEVAMLDSRVLMAHWKEPQTSADRFYSDLGLPDLVENERLREFTQAYLEASIPVVCGGHNLISGGLWMMVEEISGSGPADPETL